MRYFQFKVNLNDTSKPEEGKWREKTVRTHQQNTIGRHKKKTSVGVKFDTSTFNCIMYFGVCLLAFLVWSVPSTCGQKNGTNKTGLSSRAGFVPDGYEEVSTKKTEGYGAIEKCGEGASRGVDLCVPYYQCDSDTRMILQTGRTDGFGVIDIRFGEDKPCDHYLDICCIIPPNWSSSTPPDVEPPPPEPTKARPTLEPYGDTTPKPTPEVPPYSERPTPEVPPYSERPTPEPQPTPRPKPMPNWTCGVRNDNGVDFKITGNNNHEAEYGEFPWMVAIVKTNYNPPNDNLLICGGSLISPNVVLTAAHCVNKVNMQDMKVRVGEWDTQTEKERLPYQERNIQRVIVHEQFKPQVLFNNIALLVLDLPLEEAEHIGTICLPDQGVVYNSKECIATGWGKDKFGYQGVYQAILKKIQLPTVPNNECQDRLRRTRLGKYFVLDKSFMCAGGLKEQDTCTGDGGSPLVCPDPNQPHRYSQVGIVAWGIGCGDEIPGVYTNVAGLRSWIDDKLRSLEGGSYF